MDRRLDGGGTDVFVLGEERLGTRLSVIDQRLKFRHVELAMVEAHLGVAHCDHVAPLTPIERLTRIDGERRRGTREIHQTRLYADDTKLDPWTASARSYVRIDDSLTLRETEKGNLDLGTNVKSVLLLQRESDEHVVRPPRPVARQQLDAAIEVRSG